MNVSLTPTLDSLVQMKVKSGFYTSASEVIREALRFFLQKEKEESLHLQELTQAGLDSGEPQKMEAMATIIKEARKESML